jgi:hypothetical protein
MAKYFKKLYKLMLSVPSQHSPSTGPFYIRQKYIWPYLFWKWHLANAASLFIIFFYLVGVTERAIRGINASGNSSKFVYQLLELVLVATVIWQRFGDRSTSVPFALARLAFEIGISVQVWVLGLMRNLASNRGHPILVLKVYIEKYQ